MIQLVAVAAVLLFGLGSGVAANKYAKSHHTAHTHHNSKSCSVRH